LKLKMTSLAVAAALFGASAAPAFASNEAMMDLLKVLRDKGTISAQDYELLTNAAKADDEVVADAVNRVAKVEKSAKKSKAASWAEKIKLKGDARFRYENVTADPGGVEDDRLRLRMRLGAYAEVNDQVNVGFRIVSSGASTSVTDTDTHGDGTPNNEVTKKKYSLGSATSTNESLDEGFTSRGLNWDLAYIEFTPNALGGDSKFIFGKMKKPWQKVNDLIWDGDTNPEGIAYVGKYKMDSFTLIPSVGYYVLDDNGNGSFFDDEYLVHGQLAAKIGKKTKVGVSYFGFENNLNYTDSEKRMWELFGQTKLPGTPFTLYGSYVTSDDNTTSAFTDEDAFAVGAKAKFGSWNAGYEYRDTGVNAVNDKFDNSDFESDSKGHILKAGYKIDKNFSLGATYFITERNNDGTSSAGRERDLFQLDVKTKF
jgi:hypothetical protein